MNNGYHCYILPPQYILCLLIPLILTSTISLSSAMLTCKTPPHAVPSKLPVKLTVDSVELHAPVQFTYNEDPIIKSIQPSRSFVRSEFYSFRVAFSYRCVFHTGFSPRKVVRPVGKCLFLTRAQQGPLAD